ncbi:MAG: hypothetical protein ACQEP8_06360 [Chlamydiota bacterium]
MQIIDFLIFALGFLVFIIVSSKGKASLNDKSSTDKNNNHKNSTEWGEWLQALEPDNSADEQSQPDAVFRNEKPLQEEYRKATPDTAKDYSLHYDLEGRQNKSSITRRPYNSQVDNNYNRKYEHDDVMKSSEISSNAYQIDTDVYQTGADAYKVDEDAYKVDEDSYALNRKQELSSLDIIKSFNFPRNLVVYNAIMGSPKGMERLRR